MILPNSSVMAKMGVIVMILLCSQVVRRRNVMLNYTTQWMCELSRDEEDGVEED